MSGWVVLDTNQWDRMPMLRHGLAATLLFHVRQQEARLLLPEGIRMEVLQHLLERHELATRKAESATDELRQLLGEAPQIIVQQAEVIEDAFRRRLDELGELLEERDA